MIQTLLVSQASPHIEGPIQGAFATVCVNSGSLPNIAVQPWLGSDIEPEVDELDEALGFLASNSPQSFLNASESEHFLNGLIDAQD